MFNFIVWIVVGAIIGWIASMIAGTNGRQGMLLDIVVGLVGAFIAGLVLTPLFGINTINEGDFSFPALMMSLLGAVILLIVVKFFSGRGSNLA